MEQNHVTVTIHVCITSHRTDRLQERAECGVRVGMQGDVEQRLEHVVDELLEAVHQSAHSVLVAARTHTHSRGVVLKKKWGDASNKT